MISDFLFSGTKISSLQRSMDVSMLRQDVISNNIANVNTPNFKKQEVSFEDELNRALDAESFKGARTHPKHIIIGAGSMRDVAPKVTTEMRTSMRNDGNNVDVDEEMANLSKNTINYRTLASALDSELTKINQAIAKAGKV